MIAGRTRQRPSLSRGTSATPRISPSQVHWFRLRRSGLVDPFPTPRETARRLVGVQAQVPSAASVAFFNRTRDCSLRGLEEARLRHRTLVRFWGQRNTVHIYSTADWPLLYAAFQEGRSVLEGRLARVGLLSEFKRLVDRIRRRLEKGEQLTYRDVRSKTLEEGQDQWRVSYITFMRLVREGLICHSAEDGRESRFVHREHWTPGLAWDPPAHEDALPELARRYLAAYGPARAHDLAFWYGSSMTKAAGWIRALGDERTAVDVAGISHWCLKKDLDSMREKPPTPSRRPTRLLSRFDPLLLATQDKSWLIEDDHYKKVWRPSAQVEAVLLARGRIAGTWRYERTPQELRFRFRPFSPLPRAVANQLEQQAHGIAAFLGARGVDVIWQAPA